MEDMFRIVPLRRARIPGSTALIMETVPKKFVAKRSATSFSSPSSTAAR